VVLDSSSNMVPPSLFTTLVEPKGDVMAKFGLVAMELPGVLRPMKGLLPLPLLNCGCCCCCCPVATVMAVVPPPAGPVPARPPGIPKEAGVETAPDNA